MNPDSNLPQKRVRAMGTALAIISSIALLFWGQMSLVLLFSPTTYLSTEEVAVPEEILEEGPDFESIFLPEGVTMETTVRELMEKDREFFEAHTGVYRWSFFGSVAFFAVVAVVILRMALSWRKQDPFGPGTTNGLRWLGILFLAQFVVGWVLLFLLPSSGYDDLVIYRTMVDDLITDSGTGAGLSCGIVFLTLSWVLEQARKMKEEQALTI
jgi:hypothetical protein